MGSKDLGFDVVYRGQTLEYFDEGRYVFFQREKCYGGGYWFGQVMDGFYKFALEQPVSLRQGIEYLFAIRLAERGGARRRCV